MFAQHPSKKLNDLFREKPFQGAVPEEARILFIGLDANYAPNIENSSSFKSVQEYHQDGVAFWKRHKVHHPFLLGGYSGDGKRYHRNFARIGFTPDDADSISFIELLNVPTIGGNKLTADDLDATHLARIRSCILDFAAEHIFISPGVAKLMHGSKFFDWLPRNANEKDRPLAEYWRDSRKTVFRHLHFSNYGKFEGQMVLEAQAIRQITRRIRDIGAIRGQNSL